MKQVYLLTFLLVFLHVGNAQHIQRRGRLGVQLEPVTASIAETLGRNEARGMIIRQVFPGATYANADGAEGDVLLAINGIPANPGPDIQGALQTVREGQAARFTVWREGNTIELKGAVSPIPYETSATSDVLYGEIPYKGGYLRTIVNQPNAPGPQ